MEIEHALFSSDTLLERWKAPTNFAWLFWRQIEDSLLVLKNGSCEHTTNGFPTFSPQKQNLEIGPYERLLPVFGTKSRILKNGSSEQALTFVWKGVLSLEITQTRRGNFFMSGIWVCATDQGLFFTSKSPEQILTFYSRTGPTFLSSTPKQDPFLTIWSQTPSSNVKIPVAFSLCFLQPDVFTFVLLYLSKCFKLQ